MSERLWGSEGQKKLEMRERVTQEMLMAYKIAQVTWEKTELFNTMLFFRNEFPCRYWIAWVQNSQINVPFAFGFLKMLRIA